MDNQNFEPDGPPVVRYKGKAPFSKLVAKVEPRSRYGNPDSYEVLGKTYHVLSTSKAFKQTGLASWYGTKFHAHRTSSGEPYDMHAMTAAHKTLPLPTYVKVINKDNNRELVVKVNDRGPFHEGRIIDLSYAAAKALGVVKNGVAHVEISSVVLENDVAPKLFLQAGAFEDKAKALQYQRSIKNFINLARVNVEHKKTAYVVTIGPFEKREERDQAKLLLNRKGHIDTFSFMR